MRQNPPFNMDYITATFLLENISNKTKILNNPVAVRNIPEKLSSIYFTICMIYCLFDEFLVKIMLAEKQKHFLKQGGVLKIKFWAKVMSKIMF